MSAKTSQITGLVIVCSIVYSDADQRKHQSSASLAFVRGIHWGPEITPHEWPVTRKMFPFNDVIMKPHLEKTKHVCIFVRTYCILAEVIFWILSLMTVMTRRLQSWWWRLNYRFIYKLFYSDFLTIHRGASGFKLLLDQSDTDGLSLILLFYLSKRRDINHFINAI